eukprot:4196651-Karenia_brevis.AAC.1
MEWSGGIWIRSTSGALTSNPHSTKCDQLWSWRRCVSGETSEPIRFNKSVRQGGTESPWLFNLIVRMLLL